MCLRLLTVFFLLAVNLANCIEWIWSLLSLGSFLCWVLMHHGHINCKAFSGGCALLQCFSVV